MIDRVYVEDPLEADLISVAGPEAHHLFRVRRAAVGDRVEVFNGRGQARRAIVERVARDSVGLRLEGEPLADRRPACAITLAMAVPRGERFDWLVEKAVELGVARLVPIRAERSVVDPRASKIDRVRRAVIEASKQCGRNRLMDVEAPRDWGEVVRWTEPGDRRIAHPGAPRIGAGPAPTGSVLVAIGPEGGFSETEVQQAVGAGWRPIGLGPTILRVETAAVAACAGLLTLAEGE